MNVNVGDFFLLFYTDVGLHTKPTWHVYNWIETEWLLIEAWLLRASDGKCSKERYEKKAKRGK